VVVDIHTHMLSREWLALLDRHGDPYSVHEIAGGGGHAVHRAGAPFMTLTPGMLDYDARIRSMDAAGVDVSVVSLTCPNVFWGGPDVSLQAAQAINDSLADAADRHAGRIRWLASLPWQYPSLARAELDRACGKGAAGVMVLAHIDGVSLTDQRFAEIWQAIDARGLPVLVHPTAPPGVEQMDMQRYNLVATVGFTFDTTLAVSRMILDGFFDRYRALKVIAGHAGGYLPFLIGRLDMWHESYAPVRETIAERPSTYVDRLYVDSLVYTEGALKLTVEVFGAGHVLYGTDYPHKNGDMGRALANLDVLVPAERSMVRGGNAARMFGL
jgi:aminocarboxymuconate-semialdehyde decarboxylase